MSHNIFWSHCWQWQVAASDRVDERDIEKFTALASCGLGFAAYILRAFALSGLKLGLPCEMSLDIILHTFSDALKMSDLDDIVFQAINAAYQKASEKCAE